MRGPPGEHPGPLLSEKASPRAAHGVTFQKWGTCRNGQEIRISQGWEVWSEGTRLHVGRCAGECAQLSVWGCLSACVCTQVCPGVSVHALCVYRMAQIFTPVPPVYPTPGAWPKVGDFSVSWGQVLSGKIHV